MQTLAVSELTCVTTHEITDQIVICNDSVETPILYHLRLKYMSAKLVSEQLNVNQNVRMLGKLKLSLKHHVMKFQALLPLELDGDQCLFHAPAVFHL
jgi:hypothetical protein